MTPHRCPVHTQDKFRLAHTIHHGRALTKVYRKKIWVPACGLNIAESDDQLPGSPQRVRGVQKDVRASLLKMTGSNIATRTSTLAILERNSKYKGSYHPQEITRFRHTIHHRRAPVEGYKFMFVLCMWHKSARQGRQKSKLAC